MVWSRKRFMTHVLILMICQTMVFPPLPVGFSTCVVPRAALLRPKYTGWRLERWGRGKGEGEEMLGYHIHYTLVYKWFRAILITGNHFIQRRCPLESTCTPQNISLPKLAFPFNSSLKTFFCNPSSNRRSLKALRRWLTPHFIPKNERMCQVGSSLLKRKFAMGVKYVADNAVRYRIIFLRS